MSNPFDVPDAQYLVLVNTEGQHSLWPAFADVPAGWTIACGPASWSDCMEYVTANWTDLRPSGLVDRMS